MLGACKKLQTLLRIAQKIKNINLCILYWKDIHSNIYIIDGAHRLSCIYAWINRYFADEQVTLSTVISMIHKNKIFVTSAII